MQAFFQFVKSLGAARMAAMAAVTLALIGFFSFLMIRMTTPQMVPLFTDLSAEDSGSIIKDLERQGIAYQIKNDGAIVMVAKDNVARLRMKLAENGLPKGGGVGYEIFDKSDALGSTTFVQNINHLRALEGELARTIRGIDRVQAARVHLVLPDRPLFSRDKADPIGLDRAQSARHAGAATGARHPPSGGDRGQRTKARARFGDRRDRQAARRRRRAGQSARGRRRRRAQGGLRKAPAQPGRGDRLLGGRDRAARGSRSPPISISTASPRPPTSSIPTAAWCARARPARKAPPPPATPRAPVSVGNELPGAGKPAEGSAGNTSGDQNHKTEEIVNYEISRTTKTEVTEAGRVNRVSAAVLVDGNYTKNDKGEVAYQPRSKEEIDHIAALVRSAIGFDAKRGDQVEVVNLRFAETPPMPITEPTGWMSYLQFTKDDIMRFAEQGVMVVLGLIVLLLVVRPLVRRIVTPDGGVAGGAAVASYAGTASVAAAIGAPRAAAVSAPAPSAATITANNANNAAAAAAACRRICRRRGSGRHFQPNLRDDRRRQGARTGSRPIGAESRRAGREEPAGGGFHHPHLAPRGCSLSHAFCLQPSTTRTRPATDITGLMADLASRPQVNAGRRKLKGPEKAAVLMMALGEQYGGKIFSLLDDDELREISDRHVGAWNDRSRNRRGIAAGIRLPHVGLGRPARQL